MAKGLLINLDRCTGCDSCIVACKLENRLPLGSFYNKVIAIGPTGTFPDVEKYWLPSQCQQCENPQCVAVCPTAALELPATYTVGNPETGETGDIIIGTAEIDPRTCLAYRMTGCRDCYDACNYGAIELKDEGGANPIPYVVEDKCNGCGACQAACLSLSSGSIKSSERAIVVRPVEA